MKAESLRGVTALLLALTVHGVEADVRDPVTVIGEGKHCVIEAVATSNKTGEELAKENDDINCFSNFSDAIDFATKGQVQISFDATPNEIDKELTNGGYNTLANVIAIEYEHGNFGGASKTFTGAATCDSTTYVISNLKDVGFNDKITSAKAFAGCNHSIHYEHANYGGASVDCGTSCSNIGSSMNDNTSSIRWTR